MKLHCPEGMTQHDIGVETERTYFYPNGGELHIPEPAVLFLKRDDRGDSHRIVTKDGFSYYPARGWLGIRWKAPIENVSF